MKNNFIIGLCGHARSGKDTFCESAKILFSKKEIGAARAAFADQLKKDLDPLCRSKIGMSAFTDDPKEKELIRPLLVTYGTDIMRKLDNNWWIDKIEKTLETHFAYDLIPIVTDVRYPNEMDWAKEKHAGIIVYISRDGIGPANKEEEKNNSILESGADYNVRWPTFGEENIGDASEYVKEIVEDIYENKVITNE